MEPATPEGPELFFGLVGAIGTDLPRVSHTICDTLKKYNYNTDEEGDIRLSQLLHTLREYKDLPRFGSVPMEDYYNAHMDAGDRFRHAFGGDALAVLSMAKVRENRKKESGDEDEPAHRFAYVFRSLKHPDEVRTFRKTYGSGFVLFAAFTPREERVELLARAIATSHDSLDSNGFKSNAEQLISRDEIEVKDKLGQNVRETFPLADFFVDATDTEKMEKSVDRFLELFFSHPFHTPTRDEYGMFHAHAAALRSADLSRQVGAVICTEEGDVVAVGTNEVPRPGGGLYTEGDSPDHRDFAEGLTDPDFERKRIIITETLRRLRDNGWLNAEKTGTELENIVEEMIKEGGILKDSQLVNSISFDRVVHAEMAAITDSARRTVTVKDCILYTTTFPCHNCAKHIVASGIKKVIYIQPYPKSLALALHRDSISMDGPSGSRTVCEPFVGVAPRNYFELFTMSKRKDESGKILAWNAQVCQPRLPGTSPLSYIATEQLSVKALEKYY